MAGIPSNDDFVSEINITPFVDVMLVLLIIFMVTTPMMTEGLDVVLPTMEKADALPTDDEHLILSIRENGLLFLGEHEISITDLAFALQNAAIPGNRRLFVRGDKNIPYGTVMEVMGKIRSVGISDVGLITAPPLSQSEGGRRAEHAGAPPAGAARSVWASSLFLR
ncbi:MAG: ExbD/TolR family protein [Desulfovibrio sp.]|jgi:biopolymer transport protein TolR|nr:ExbD/TolR family protein [Desulfovibrio sp.]